MGKHKSRKHDRESSSSSSEDERERRRSQKKIAKVAKSLGYSNEINPFGDSNLLQPFKWGKKDELMKGRPKEEENEEEKRISLIKDIEKIRKRREERDLELEAIEKARADEQKLRESIAYSGWEQKEEEFHLEQTKERSKLRLLAKRERPVDLLAHNILIIETEKYANADVHKRMMSPDERDALVANLATLETADISDPIALIHSLSYNKLKDLQDDVENYLELEEKKNGDYIEFWDSIRRIVRNELRVISESDGQHALHKTVIKEVEKLLKNKSIAELRTMYDDIKRDLKARRYSDVEYWTCIADEISNECSKMIVRKKFQYLQEARRELISSFKDRVSLVKKSMEDDCVLPSTREDTRGSNYVSDAEKALLTANEPALEENESYNELDHHEEVPLPEEVYSWASQYTPRKPRYYNRVKLGYNWSRYNIVHYSVDNPPPKTVLGYKFIILYPDLLDYSQTPSFHMHAAPEPEYAIIRFHAGPPYEDIAFKILNVQWNKDNRSGYKVTFEKGVLQVFFNFRAIVYKR